MSTAQGLATRIDRLKADVVDQSRRVLAVIEAAFAAVFDSDHERAAWVAQQDDAIDTADVAIERAAVQLLFDAAATTAQFDHDQLRMVLTIVKINNELERIADAAVDVAALVPDKTQAKPRFPDTFRVMANSVIGILRDTGTSVHRNDAAMSRVVLQSQHAVTNFKAAILRDAENQIAAGKMSVDFAFRLHEIASQCELMADHCTNIAEQVIYATSGAIVRHLPTKWVDVPQKPQ